MQTEASTPISILRSSIQSVRMQTLHQLADEWRALTDEGPFAEPFFQPEWFSAFASTIEPLEEILLATVRCDQSLRAIAPFFSRSHFFCGIPAKTLRSLSSVHSCRFDLSHEGSDPDRITRASWDALRNQRDWNVIEALDVPTDGSFMRVLRYAKEAGFLVGTWPTRKSPFLTLPERGRDPFENCPKSFRTFRSRLKNKLKQLAHEHKVSFEVYTDRYEEALRSFFTLEASGWKGAKGSAIAANQPLVRFYSRLAADCARRGHLRMYALTANSKPIAMHLGLCMNGTYYTPKVAYDEEFSRFAPGHLLVNHVIQDLVEQGMRRFDFLGPRAKWKVIWTDQVREHNNCYIFRPTIKGRLLYNLTMKLGPMLRALRHRIQGDPQEISL